MIDDAVAYARKHTLHALIVKQRGKTIAEAYGEGYDAEAPHALYSGTKSFWGVCAAAAAADGLLDLDEPVADTITQWRDDPRKSVVTIRQLLDLTSGFAFGGLGAGVPGFDAALDKPLANEPGTAFTYGGIPLQVFGAVFSRKLQPLGQTPVEYLKARILEPAGVEIASWRTLKDGTHTMPTGAMLAASEWIKYGELLVNGGTCGGKQVVDAALVSQCWTPGSINPKYGLGFWLLQPRGEVPFVAYASGAGKQALYAIPDADMAIVHFSRSNSYNHETFLRRLFTGSSAGA